MRKALETYIKTGCKEYDELFPRVKAFLKKDVLEVDIDGKRIRGYRSPDTKSIWIRDYSDMIRGFKYFESDLLSTVSHFAENQSYNGRIFDYFTTSPEKLPCEKENWTKYVRVPVEADVEYRFIKAAFLAWQATGDDDWIYNLIPNMIKAIDYIFNNEQRFDKKNNLVKRPYTIDTWDFAYTAGKHEWLQFQIDKDSYWGIFHGDNSGYYDALQKMGFLLEYFNRKEDAQYFLDIAEELAFRTNELCWNGKFYTHFVKISPVKINGIDESQQLSLSNPININRGITDHKMASSIIKEYIRRKEIGNSFAEWFSIDPPFPDGIFGDEKLIGGAYINGGIMPLVGGELAKAAFDNGFEEYGCNILKRYYNMISENDESYLWYFPDGTPSSLDTSTSPDATPTDGWGSSAMLYSLIEGLAGVEDMFKEFRNVRLSPRWLIDDIFNAEVNIKYCASNASFYYKYTCKEDEIQLVIDSHASNINCHILIPSGKKVKKLVVDGKMQKFDDETIEKSNYVNFIIEFGKAIVIVYME